MINLGVKILIHKFKIIWFWIVAFSVIIWNSIKGNEWHMMYANFHLGNDENGNPIRRQLIAKRGIESFDVYWQDLN